MKQETGTAMAETGALVAALEEATLMAKHFPNPDPTRQSQIYSSLLAAQRRLSLFLSRHPPPPPENAASSAEPMQVEEDGDGGTGIDAVEERMRRWCIQNKRPKRALSPSSTAAEQRRSYVSEVAARVRFPAEEFDPEGSKVRSLDLIHQFHG